MKALALLLLGSALVGCYLGAGSDNPDAADARGGYREQGTRPAGVPCAVAELLAKYCTSCHGSAPSSGVPLLSLADLKNTAKSDPSKNVAQLALARIRAGTMPPAGATAPGAGEIAAFESWVNSGLPAGSCDLPDAGPDPFGGPHVCTSNTYYNGGEGPAMEPGNACMSCHSRSGEDEAPRFSIAGSVYPTAHEPSRCQAAGVAGAQVQIVDAIGSTHLYTVDAVGNFAGSGSIALPFRAQVQYGGKTRAMAAAQTNGDCNICHTENGAEGAPGRILLPK